MIKVMFIGDAPSPNMKPGAPAFTGARCQPRLAAWMRTMALNWEDIITVNQVNPALKAYISEAVERKLPIVAVGLKASSALDKMLVNGAKVSFFRLPHPSGRNRQLNNPKYVESLLSLCTNWLFEQGAY